MRFLLLLSIVVLAAACDSVEPDMEMGVQSEPPNPNAAESLKRFKITRVGVFKDDLAYGGKRGVYQIRDVHTGKEWVGVSGVGISQLGCHDDGNDGTDTDER